MKNAYAFAKSYAEKVGLPKSGLEFQMLYGIRRDLQEKLSKEGYPVRVYVPFGTHWYPYFMRRLAERPANIWFFVSNFSGNNKFIFADPGGDFPTRVFFVVKHCYG